MNHVFVDFENMHHVDLALFESKPVNLTLLLGAKQTKLDAGLVEKLIEHAASVKLIRLSSSGRNALDFTLAYYVGRAAALDPAGYFHIVSKDTGFDPLIAHLRNRRIRAHRHDDFVALTFSGPKPLPAAPPSTPASAAATSAPAEDLFPRVLTHLRQHAKNRPKQRKTLERHLLSLCGKGTTESDVASLITRLIKSGKISLNDKGAVIYSLS
ncbi:MAG TPA: PIN domain-containing protein [Verrucomicrobiales bacterium]|nr:PIN domain-containing protein [Verrucomicrobiales bacterium]